MERKITPTAGIETNHFTVLLSIPMSTPIVFVYTISISDAKNFFENRYASATDLEEKEEFKRAYTLLEYASFCDAELVRIGRDGHKIAILLKFSTIDSLTNFVNTMEACVSASMQN